MGLGEAFVNAGMGAWQADRDRAAAGKRRRADMEFLQGLDYEPAYASQTAPTFQRSESPMARKYMESFLAGNNPDATFSGAPNAGIAKTQQRASGDAMFGTDQAMIDRGAALRQKTPWAVNRTPSVGAGGKGGQGDRSLNDFEDIHEARFPAYKDAGLTQSHIAKLKERGIDINELMMRDGMKDGDETMPGSELSSDRLRTLAEAVDNDVDDEALHLAYANAFLGGGAKKSKKRGPVRDWFRGG